VRKNLEHFFPGASISVLPGYPDEKDLVHVALYLARSLEKAGLPVHPEKAMDGAMKRPFSPVIGAACESFSIQARAEQIRTILQSSG
jgi:hypothetical protein